MPELLTPKEHLLLELLGDVANGFVAIMAPGAGRDGDMGEAVHHIHVLQRMVMAQAAARAYPDRYRLIGGDHA